ncbi:ribose-5-phosphate isomerase rki1 [Tulasnella sp. 408]|nr:ribose-5-phosphate isomerase rki1 [Tulasnella sp. 408]
MSQQIEAAKKLAAYTAVDNHVKPTDKLIGIGSGFQSKQLIVNGGLRLGDVSQYTHIDVTIDGADEVDSNLNCIKGGGACQLQEKVLAEAANTFIVVADYRKKSSILGTSVSLKPSFLLREVH